jgi:aryl-alcohol dehydrogenase-like predicted oxidoreductase
MPRHRDRFFLATKTEERTKQGARKSLHRSLERLQTDHVDLFQIHNLSDTHEWKSRWQRFGGVIEARDKG